MSKEKIFVICRTIGKPEMSADVYYNNDDKGLLSLLSAACVYE